MRIVVVGGSGHIGSFLVPRLVQAGHEVVNISRTATSGYSAAPQWQRVRQVVADRQHQDDVGSFGKTVLAQRPDVVVDLICFTLDSAVALTEALRGKVAHLLHCGSIWRYGASRKLPIAEDSDAGTTDAPSDAYGIEKRRIAQMLKAETASGGLVTTSVHPGHVVGPGWHPIGPLGNLDPSVWEALSAGTPISVPGSGTEMMHHVHADDVAQMFELAIERRAAAAGEDFNALAPTALSVRGYIEIASGWFGQTSRLESVSWEQYREATAPEHAETSWAHLHRSHAFTIEKAKTVLGYAPRYEPDAAVRESVRWLIENGQLDVSRPLQG